MSEILGEYDRERTRCVQEDGDDPARSGESRSEHDKDALGGGEGLEQLQAGKDHEERVAAQRDQLDEDEGEAVYNRQGCEGDEELHI